ncbi:MAG: DUF1178 family protein [Candidatus Dadabacteria bacterium]|nr:MAG: DUF1178 family protein [Candidatus Dadabacteria bacterium]
MITFDLSCDQGHRFEGWFRNREEFERQLAEGLLVCPLCGSGKIKKEPSAPAVHVARRTAPETPPPGAGQAEKPRPEAFFLALARFVEKHFEDVGDRFADEARKIHRGEAEARNIRGTTTQAEEEALREEGVEFLKVPLPKYDA